ncbi:MAG: hypothetical protein ACSW8J_00915 [bacterium]
MRISMNPTRFGTPGMGEEIEKVYGDIYGDGGPGFIQVMRESPYEVAVLSRLIAYMEQKRKGEC